MRQNRYQQARFKHQTVSDIGNQWGDTRNDLRMHMPKWVTMKGSYSSYTTLRCSAALLVSLARYNAFVLDAAGIRSPHVAFLELCSLVSNPPKPVPWNCSLSSLTTPSKSTGKCG